MPSTGIQLNKLLLIYTAIEKEQGVFQYTCSNLRYNIMEKARWRKVYCIQRATVHRRKKSEYNIYVHTLAYKKQNK